VSERIGKAGCWITSAATIGQLRPQPIFWHVASYRSRAQAETAKGPRGKVVESLGKVWLLNDRNRGLAAVRRRSRRGNWSAAGDARA